MQAALVAGGLVARRRQRQAVLLAVQHLRMCDARSGIVMRPDQAYNVRCTLRARRCSNPMQVAHPPSCPAFLKPKQFPSSAFMPHRAPRLPWHIRLSLLMLTRQPPLKRCCSCT